VNFFDADLAGENRAADNFLLAETDATTTRDHAGLS
jgi:hypothetical protein